MTRRELIEAEAKRRCIAGGYTLETPARALTSMGDREGPLWQAYVPRIALEIERIEQAGFVVDPPKATDWRTEVLSVVVFTVLATGIAGVAGTVVSFVMRGYP
jgi:hypothetical protein